MRAYEFDADRFRTFAGKPLRMVTVGDVQGFADSIEHLADASRARALSAVKSLLSYGHDSAQITVFGKGGRTRHVLLSQGTWDALRAIRGEAGPDDAVFRSTRRAELWKDRCFGAYYSP